LAIVITNGTYYIKYSNTGKIQKTKELDEAHQFVNVKSAITGMKRAEKKTKNYVVFDTFTRRALWKRMTREELIAIQENKGIVSQNGTARRKTFSQDTRKMIYDRAGGRCELCGRKILFEDMTLDHIQPLAKGGSNDVDNLAATCYQCNLLKGNILPEDFFERITMIFCHQVEKKCCNSICWKIIYRAILKSL